MITWPSELPQAPVQDWSDEYVSGLVDHEEMSNPLRRRTHPDRAATFRFSMTPDQRNAYAAWWSGVISEQAPFSAPWLQSVDYGHHVCMPAGVPEYELTGVKWLVTVPVRVVAVAPAGLPELEALAASGLAAVDDSYSTDSETAVALSVLANDAGGSLAVTRVAGSSLLVGRPVMGSTGGTFTIAANGTGVFDPGSDFSSGPSRSTSVTYAISDGTHADVGSVEVDVTWVGDESSVDPLWEVVLLVWDGSTGLVEGKGHTMVPSGDVVSGSDSDGPYLYFPGGWTNTHRVTITPADFYLWDIFTVEIVAAFPDATYGPIISGSGSAHLSFSIDTEFRQVFQYFTSGYEVDVTVKSVDPVAQDVKTHIEWSFSEGSMRLFIDGQPALIQMMAGMEGGEPAYVLAGLPTPIPAPASVSDFILGTFSDMGMAARMRLYGARITLDGRHNDAFAVPQLPWPRS